MTIHRLKAHPEPFDAVLAGRKTFEWRRDDRDPPFAVDDHLELAEWDPGADHGAGAYTGRELTAAVSYVLRGAFGVSPGFAVLALKAVGPKRDQLAEDRKLVRRLCDFARGMTDWEVRFVESIARQVETGRVLSDAQRSRAEQVDEDRVR